MMGPKHLQAPDETVTPGDRSGPPGTPDHRRSFASENAFHLAVTVISFCVFASLLAGVVLKGGFLEIDRSVDSGVPSIQSAQFTPAAIFIGLVFDTVGIVMVMLAAAVYLRYRGASHDSSVFFFLVVVSVTLVELLKFLVHRERPHNMITGQAGYSFPSGHATMAVVLFGSIIYMACRKGISKFTRRLVVAVSVFMILLIGLDRIYLDVHWLSDVIGGFALGTFLVSGTILLRSARRAWGYCRSGPARAENVRPPPPPK